MNNWIKREPKIKYNENDNIILKLVKIRGIDKPHDFFKPTPDMLHNPYLLDNIDKATNKIIEAIKNNWLIGISIDPDFDGISSGVLMYRYLSQITNKDNLYYLYCQRSQGHGIEYQQDMVKPKTKLLIICDSSTNSTSTCQKLSQQGMDIVILDHHPKEIDNQFATIVNPQICDYPNKQLSSVGVVWKTIQVIDEKLKTNYANNYLDLVAFGMYGDMMSVAEFENRYIMYSGLKNISNPGLKSILKVSGVNNVDSSTIGFTVAPYINGAARLDQIELSIQLLIEDDSNVTNMLASKIKDLNDKRKTVEERIFQSLIPQIKDDDKIIIVVNETEISKGFNGLIANRISNAYQRPSIVLARDKDGFLKGSFRSYAGFNVRDFLREFKYIRYSEGHPEAGGTGFYEDKIDSIRKTIKTKLKDVEFKPKYEYDIEIDNSEEITDKLIERVEMFNHLTGQGFPPAKFRINNLMVVNRSVLGGGNTIKLECAGSEKEDGLVLMKFRTNPNWQSDIGVFDKIDVVGQLNLNRFYNYSKKEMIVTKQLFIDDIRKT